MFSNITDDAKKTIGLPGSTEAWFNLWMIVAHLWHNRSKGCKVRWASNHVIVSIYRVPPRWNRLHISRGRQMQGVGSADVLLYFKYPPTKQMWCLVNAYLLTRWRITISPWQSGLPLSVNLYDDLSRWSTNCRKCHRIGRGEPPAKPRWNGFLISEGRRAVIISELTTETEETEKYIFHQIGRRRFAEILTFHKPGKPICITLYSYWRSIEVMRVYNTLT